MNKDEKAGLWSGRIRILDPYEKPWPDASPMQGAVLMQLSRH